MNGNTANRLGKAIRSWRERLGLSQEELGFRSKLHRTYVADIERGARNPSLASVVKLAEALKLSLSELLENVHRVRRSSRSTHGGDGNGQEPWNGHLVEVLLVEDNDGDAELAIRALKKCNLGNLIHRVTDGYEALDFIFQTGHYVRRRPTKESPVILLDLNLPGLNGLEVLRRIKSDPRSRTIPVIVLALSQRSKDIAESRRLGADDYIVKPVDFEQFGSTMPRVGFHWLLLKNPPWNTNGRS